MNGFLDKIKKAFTSGDTSVAKRYVSFGMSLASLLFPLWLMFISFCVNVKTEESIVPIKILSFDGNMLFELVLFVVLFILCSISFAKFLRSVKYYSSAQNEFVFKAQKLVNFNTVITGAYYLVSIVFCTVINTFGGSYTVGRILHIPFIMSVIFSLAFAFIARHTVNEIHEGRKTTSFLSRFELYIYSLFASAFTVVACLTDIFTVNFKKPSSLDPIDLNGLNAIKTYNSKSESFQLVAFVLIAMLTVICVLTLLSTIAVISRSKSFYSLALASLICSGIFTMLIGLFGKYYEIVQKMNEEKITEWLSQYILIQNFEMEYQVKSQAFIWFVVVVFFAVLTLIRKPYSKGIRIEAGLERSARRDSPVLSGVLPTHGSSTASDVDFDPCPAFTELDKKADELRTGSANLASSSAFEAPSLPALVQFVVNYARDSRLHLSYTASDIAAFIAGLGATRLTILQGMSGTGKTSLPKIFTEAIGGRCDIIEIESSWRDKNELLGYYNEFSRMYTPKKFTQALYRASLDPDRLTFIVLDEMNLSRIEYYFSDFLSLMENEEDKRELKISNVGLFKESDGERYSYTALLDGHTIKIPKNIWFVGTANRDDSTFEISDKVYDRAHTMNFNKRAPRAVSLGAPIPPRYVSSDVLTSLLENAKKNVSFDIDSCAVIREVEELLSPYNISFGNRIANQMEDFVKIYAACFSDGESAVNEAVETILLSKVVAKLEFKNVENKKRLAGEFERLRLFRCSEFILKLNED